MRSSLKKAIQDLSENRFLNGVTVLTIALAVLIVGAFFLVFTNASELADAWHKNIRIMVYLTPGTDQARRLEIGYHLKRMPVVSEARFISRKAGLEELRAQMPGQVSLFAGLKKNPLPDAYELRLSDNLQDVAGIESLAHRLADIPAVQDVEYGQQWLEQAASALEIIRLAGLVLGALFFTATAFIVGNTIRLVIYSRREEIEIMRLVGATDRFICTPFYFLGLLQGAAGGLIGLIILLVVFWTLRAQVEPGLWVGPFHIHFLPLGMQLAMVAASMVVGCLGCFLSLQQFLKR